MTILMWLLFGNPLESNRQLRKELGELRAHVIALQESVLVQGDAIVALQNEPRPR